VTGAGRGLVGLVGLHHVQLACPRGSEDVLREFYVGVLGMAEVAKPPALAGRGGAWFRAGLLELHLGVEEDFRPARKAHPGLLVADLPAYAERLAAQGVAVEWDDDFPGYRRCYLTDPHGNRLELMEPLDR
jgi:catechol 2,3-dioxygenase-like lactoylglutathione lyase family enzyme